MRLCTAASVPWHHPHCLYPLLQPSHHLLFAPSNAPCATAVPHSYVLRLPLARSLRHTLQTVALQVASCELAQHICHSERISGKESTLTCCSNRGLAGQAEGSAITCAGGVGLCHRQGWAAQPAVCLMLITKQICVLPERRMHRVGRLPAASPIRALWRRCGGDWVSVSNV